MRTPLRCPTKLARGTMIDVMTKAPKGAKLMGNWISPKMLKLLIPPAIASCRFKTTFWPILVVSKCGTSRLLQVAGVQDCLMCHDRKKGCYICVLQHNLKLHKDITFTIALKYAACFSRRLDMTVSCSGNHTALARTYGLQYAGAYLLRAKPSTQR